MTEKRIRPRLPATRCRSRLSWAGGLLLGLLLAGCGLLAPRPEAVLGPERAAVVGAFETMHRHQAHCRCCLDAAVAVTLKGLLGSGTVSGYLQAMSPSYLRFVGLNPLGQPLLLLVTDGERFQYLAVTESKEYIGSVRAETFVKYAPPGFQPREAYFWLTGRMPDGPLQVTEVTRADGSGCYWLMVNRGGQRHRLLFDREAGRILRHQLLDGGEGVEMDVVYEDPKAVGAAGCLLPARLSVTTDRHSGTLVVVLSDWREEVALSKHDFTFDRPPGFTEVVVP